MAVGSICPRCGRAGTGENVSGLADYLTQEVYLISDGYAFHNAQWNMNTLPEPTWWEEIIDDLHKEVKPTPSRALIRTDYFHLYRFKFRWIFTNQIIAQLPYASWKKDTKTYEGRDWFKVATFLLPPNNDPETNFTWCQGKIEECWIRAGYIYEHDKVKEAQGIWDGKWVYKGEYNKFDKEKPTDEELEFLKHTEKLLTEYKNEYTHTKEVERIIYDENYLNEMKLERNKYDTEKGMWGVKSPQLKIIGYRQLSISFLHELDKLIHHIERKMDYKRTGLELYQPVSITKINDDTLLMTMERDFMAEWYPKLLKLKGCWKFQIFPLTKEVIEKFHKRKWRRADGTEIDYYLPLQSCVFCPGNENDASGRSDDYAFDSEILVAHDDFKGKDDKNLNLNVGKWQEWAKERQKDEEEKIRQYYTSQAVGEISDVLKDQQKLRKNISDADLAGMNNLIKDYKEMGLEKGEEGFIDDLKERIDFELNRRESKRKDLEKNRQDTQERLEKNREQQEKLSKQIENWEKQMVETQELQEIKEKELAENLRKQEQKTTDFKALEKKRSELEEERINLTRIRDQAQIEFNRTDRIMQSMATLENAQERSRQQQELDRHSDKINSAETDISQNRIDINKNASDISQIRLDLNHLESRQYNLERDISNLDRKYDKLEEKYDEANGRIGTLELGRIADDDKLKDLDEKIKDKISQPAPKPTRGGGETGTTGEARPRKGKWEFLAFTSPASGNLRQRNFATKMHQLEIADFAKNNDWVQAINRGFEWYDVRIRNVQDAKKVLSWLIGRNLYITGLKPQVIGYELKMTRMIQEAITKYDEGGVIETRINLEYDE